MTTKTNLISFPPFVDLYLQANRNRQPVLAQVIDPMDGKTLHLCIQTINGARTYQYVKHIDADDHYDKNGRLTMHTQSTGGWEYNAWFPPHESRDDSQLDELLGAAGDAGPRVGKRPRVHQGLTPANRQLILEAIADGLSEKEIGRRMRWHGVSVSEVKSFLAEQESLAGTAAQ